MKYDLTKELRIRYPIFQGGMANISDGKFAAAVSEAGGLGIIYSAGRPPEDILKDIEICRSLTDKPFGVNAVMQPPDMVPKLVDMLISQQVPVITTSAGNPIPWISSLKSSGSKIYCVVANVKQAEKAAAAGADGIIAEGEESGGHIGNTGTMSLLPAVLSAVTIPVIAAGGIADGRGMAACMMLGASGVQCGTVFLATEECPISDTYKKAILDASVSDTVVTGKVVNDVVRSIKSPLSEKMLRLELGGCSPEDIISLGTGSLRRAIEGDWENGSFQAGQSAGLVNEIRTVNKVIESMMSEMREILS